MALFESKYHVSLFFENDNLFRYASKINGFVSLHRITGNYLFISYLMIIERTINVNDFLGQELFFSLDCIMCFESNLSNIT